MDKYQLIYADPPWAFNQRAVHTETKFGGGVHGQYPVMNDGDILGLVNNLAPLLADQAVLFLWATPSKGLALTQQVIERWGFRYCTRAFVWVKTYPSGKTFRGPGYTTASNAEDVYIAFKGKPLTPRKRLVDSVIIEPHPRKDGKIWHSAKPETVRQRIDEMYPDLRKLEMFGRSLVPGWDVVGNDVSGMDIREELDGLAALMQVAE